MISVVIPLYNKAAFIMEAIASVQAQTFTDWELIVVDDGSRDEGPAQVARCGDPRVRLLRKPNGGVSSARNAGIEAARGSHVALLDADDWWEPGHLAGLAAVMAHDPGALLVGSAFLYADEAGRTWPSALREAWRDAREGFVRLDDLAGEMADLGMLLNASSVLVSKYAVQSLGGFPSGIKTGEDLLTWLRLSCRGPVYLAVRPTSVYRAPPIAGIGHLRMPQTPDLVAAGLRELMRAHPDKAAGLRRFLAHWHRIRAIDFMQLGLRRPSFVDLMRAVRLDRMRARDAVSLMWLPLPTAASIALLERYRRWSRRSAGAKGAA